VLNNPDAWLPVEDWPGLRYAVWQLEMGEQGTVHYQMYLNFKNPVSMVALHKLEGLERCAAKMRKGTKLEAAQYCWKDESRLEGPFWFPNEEDVKKFVNRGRGARTDLESLAALVATGATNRMIAAEMPVMVIRYQRGINDLRAALTDAGARGAEIDSIVYWGPSGTGKSRRLLLECPPGPDWFWVMKGKWFNAYDGQAGLVFDEFTDAWCTYGDMKRLLDIYPLKVETKGGVVEMRAWRFRFSSNHHPRNWWRQRPGKEPWEDDPLRRRLRLIQPMTERYIGPAVAVVDIPTDYVDPYEIAPLRADAAGVLWNGRINEEI